MSSANKIDVRGVFIDKSNAYSRFKKTVGRITTADGIMNNFPKFFKKPCPMYKVLFLNDEPLGYEGVTCERPQLLA